MTIGERIKSRRKELGYSAEYIAEKLGISPATIYRYENGSIKKIPSIIVTKIASILDTSFNELVGFDDPLNGFGLTGEPETYASLADANPTVRIYDRLNLRGKAEYIRYGNYLCDQEEYTSLDNTKDEYHFNTTTKCL